MRYGLVKARQFPLCIKCLRPTAPKQTDCTKCGKDMIHGFDSQSEASRFIYLKTANYISNLKIQVPIPIHVLQAKLEVYGLANQVPAQFALDKKKSKKARDYKIDFAYMNHKTGMIHYDEFKPSRSNKGKYTPLIDGETKIKLGLASTVLEPMNIAIGVSYPIKQGYGWKGF